MTKNPNRWHVKLQHFGTRKTQIIVMPGGLHEAEAGRCASLKLKDGRYWKVVSVELVKG